MIRFLWDFHTSSLGSSSSTSVDTEGTLGLCHEIWSRRSLKRDPWLAAWGEFECTHFQRGPRKELLTSATSQTHSMWYRGMFEHLKYIKHNHPLQPHPNLPNPAPAQHRGDEQSPGVPGTGSVIRESPVSLLTPPGGTSPSAAPPAAAPSTIKLKLGEQSLWNVKIQRQTKVVKNSYFRDVKKYIHDSTYILSFWAGLKSYNNT